MRKIHKMAVIITAGTLILAGRTAVTYASEEPVAGINLVLEELLQNTETKEAIIQNLLEEVSKETDTLAFAQVSNYVSEKLRMRTVIFLGSFITILLQP